MPSKKQYVLMPTDQGEGKRVKKPIHAECGTELQSRDGQWICLRCLKSGYLRDFK